MMRSKIKSILGSFLLLGVFGVLLFINRVSAAPSQGLNITAAEGIVKVEGEDTIVTIWVNTEGSNNPHAAAQATLKRAYPDARPVPANYAATGNAWDVFYDGDPTNDFVNVRYNGNDAPGGLVDHRQVFIDSMQTWTNVPTSTFVFQDSGDTGKCGSLILECRGRQRFDGNNDFMWINLNDPQVLGVTWSGTVTDEFDIAVDNNDFSWYIGDPASIGPNQIDLQTVETHEFGHGLALGHSLVNGSVMEAIYAGPRRLLHQDDIDGVTFLYPSGVAPSPTPTPVPTTTPAPTPTPDPTPTPVPGDMVSVSSITYSTEGGRQGNKHLNTELLVLSDGSPVSGAVVSVTLDNATTGQSWVGTGTTGLSGTLIFTLKNSPSGAYSTTVNGVQATGLIWDGDTPSNGFTK